MHEKKAVIYVPKTKYRLFKQLLGKVYFTVWQYYEVQKGN